jgi:hypothetical protein
MEHIMAATTYTNHTQPAVGQALGELAKAARHLLVALAAQLTARSGPALRTGNRTEEAAEARAMATRWARTDPRVAAEICCAADRHEMGG